MCFVISASCFPGSGAGLFEVARGPLNFRLYRSLADGVFDRTILLGLVGLGLLLFLLFDGLVAFLLELLDLPIFKLVANCCDGTEAEEDRAEENGESYAERNERVFEECVDERF